MKKSAASKRLAKERKLQQSQYVTASGLLNSHTRNSCLILPPYSIRSLLPDHLDQASLSSTPPPSSYTLESLQQLRDSTPSTPAALRRSAADPETDLTAEKFPSTIGVSLRGMAIPDANAIHAAKKKRELLRQGVKVRDEEDDFMRLEDVSRSREAG